MTKQWDLQDLLERLKKNGLVLVEKEAKDATSCILDWAGDSLAMGESSLEKLAAPVPALIKGMVLNLEDGIDGIKGN